MKDTMVSVVVPVSRENKRLSECMSECMKLDYGYYEIIVLPDEEFCVPHGVRVIPTGPVGPAAKRNIGINNARGGIVAFIDDDTYPQKGWLGNAVRNFSDPDVAAVGGPAVTPESDNARQKAGGRVYESLLGGGGCRYRYIPQNRRYVDDFPSCNFIVRKDILDQLGGFKTNFWPGEDTVLCLNIVHKLGKKIVYDPEVILYHHRRELFAGHLRQVSAYALHRGYFVKRFPKTSLRPGYFVPSLFVLFLAAGWIFSLRLYIFVIAVYILSALVSARGIMAALGIISTHIVYGIFFVKGILSRRLREE